MPRSKNRKNHKNKVNNFKNRTNRKKKMLNEYFNNMLVKLNEQRNVESGNSTENNVE